MTGEDRRQALVRARHDVPAASGLSPVDWRVLEREARQKLADWRGLLTRQVTHGRQLLSAPVAGPIVFTPFEHGYRFRGKAALGWILGGVVDVLERFCTPRGTAFGMASPRGLPAVGQPVGGWLRAA